MISMVLLFIFFIYF